MIMAKGKRYNPPSEDFAETKLKLQWAEARIVNLVEENERLKAVIEDIQDDSKGDPYELKS